MSDFLMADVSDDQFCNNKSQLLQIHNQMLYSNGALYADRNPPISSISPSSLMISSNGGNTDSNIEMTSGWQQNPTSSSSAASSSFSPPLQQQQNIDTPMNTEQVDSMEGSVFSPFKPSSTYNQDLNLFPDQTEDLSSYLSAVAPSVAILSQLGYNNPLTVSPRDAMIKPPLEEYSIEPMSSLFGRSSAMHDMDSQFYVSMRDSYMDQLVEPPESIEEEDDDDDDNDDNDFDDEYSYDDIIFSSSEDDVDLEDDYDSMTANVKASGRVQPSNSLFVSPPSGFSPLSKNNNIKELSTSISVLQSDSRKQQAKFSINNGPIYIKQEHDQQDNRIIDAQQYRREPSDSQIKLEFSEPSPSGPSSDEEYQPPLSQHHNNHNSNSSDSASSKASRRKTPVSSQAGPHRCDIINAATGKPCNKVFSRPYDLVRHNLTIHAAVRKTFRCDLCGEASKTFSRMDALSRHVRVKHARVA